jgi:hypothetical protein
MNDDISSEEFMRDWEYQFENRWKKFINDHDLIMQKVPDSGASGSLRRHIAIWSIFWSSILTLGATPYDWAKSWMDFAAWKAIRTSNFHDLGDSR